MESKNGVYRKEFLELLFPNRLNKDEKIVLAFAKFHNGRMFERGFDSIAEVEKVLEHYKHAEGKVNRSIYFCLSTSKPVKNSKSIRKTENMHKRYCIGLDFDKKDYGEGHDIVGMFVAGTGLEPHIIVDSGFGLHMYLLIEETTDIVKVAELTGRYARLANADKVATGTTQLLRMPYSYNYKQYKKEGGIIPQVEILTNKNDLIGVERYTLNELEAHLVKQEKHKGIAHKEWESELPPRTKMPPNKGYVCVQNMLKNGVRKGHRNKCLGRITNYFRDVLKYDKGKALDDVLLWNDKCSLLCIGDEKSEREITADFNRYWKNKNYSLLGCPKKSNEFSDIVADYCDKKACSRKMNKKGASVYFDSRYLTDRNMKALDGYAYSVMYGLLCKKDEYQKASELKKITGLKKTTVWRALQLLIKLKIVEEDAVGINTYRLIPLPEQEKPKLYRISVLIFDKLGKEEIKEDEVKCYIALRKNVLDRKSCVMVEVGKMLGCSTSTIGRYVSKMDSSKLIIKERIPLNDIEIKYHEGKEVEVIERSRIENRRGVHSLSKISDEVIEKLKLKCRYARKKFVLPRHFIRYKFPLERRPLSWKEKYRRRIKFNTEKLEKWLDKLEELRSEDFYDKHVFKTDTDILGEKVSTKISDINDFRYFVEDERRVDIVNLITDIEKMKLELEHGRDVIEVIYPLLDKRLKQLKEEYMTNSIRNPFEKYKTESEIKRKWSYDPYADEIEAQDEYDDLDFDDEELYDADFDEGDSLENEYMGLDIEDEDENERYIHHDIDYENLPF